MPLLNQQNQPPVDSVTPLIEVLEDIAKYVQIQENLCISHPRYDTLELRPEILNSLQTLDVPLQDRYVRLRLGSYLYGIYDSDGNLGRIDPDPDSENESMQSRPALNMASGVKSSFYAALNDNNTGKGYFDSGWMALKESSDGLLAVQKDGLTLHVSRDRHLNEIDRSAEIGDWVAVHLPRNLLEADCYVAVSNAGLPQTANQEEDPLVNVYFNLDAEEALILMKELTIALNPLALPFKFKVPLDKENCDRPDCIGLTFSKAHYPAIQPHLSAIYQKQQAQYRPETPLFTKFLAPGLALAELPRQSFTPQESFGLNRHQIIAEGLLSAWRQQNNAPAERMSAIRQSFAAYGIDLDYAYLNPGSEDLSW
jgi:HopA1 effector protein family